MTLDEFREYCLAKPGVTAGHPFGPGTLVLKVGSKMFTCLSEDESPLKVNLKSDPQVAVELRDRYEDVTPGYHMNKRHWNTVNLEGAVPEEDVLAMIDESYDLVYAGLKKAEKEEITG